MNLSPSIADNGIGSLLVRQKHDEIGLAHHVTVKRGNRVSRKVRFFWNIGISACAPSGVALRCPLDSGSQTLFGDPVGFPKLRFIHYVALVHRPGLHHARTGNRVSREVPFPNWSLGTKRGTGSLPISKEVPLRLATNGHLNCKSASLLLANHDRAEKIQHFIDWVRDRIGTAAGVK